MLTMLTPQDEELIARYQHKWKSIYLSTARIDRNRIRSILEAVFRAYPKSLVMPEVMFFDSPYAAFSYETSHLETLYGDGQARTDLWFDLDMDLASWMASKSTNLEVLEALRTKLTDRLGSKLYEQVWNALWNWLDSGLRVELQNAPDVYSEFHSNFIEFDLEWASYAGLFDFYIHELDFQCDEEQWSIYQAMCSECTYWFLPTSHHYVVCDRPTKILLNEQGQLHSEEEPAIQYGDGFGLYAKHDEICSICFPQV